jgi:hypothetical protein
MVCWDWIRLPRAGSAAFEIYMQQRAERLANLVEGRIDLSFLLHQDEARAVLDISLTTADRDSISTAVWTINAALSESNEGAFGRGIALVKSLCDQVVYSGTGNKVWCRYWFPIWCRIRWRIRSQRLTGIHSCQRRHRRRARMPAAVTWLRPPCFREPA